MTVWLLSLSVLAAGDGEPVRIGAKAFAESVLLREIAAGLGGHQGMPIRKKEFAGTVVAWTALLAGEIDIYPEYTGTLRHEILAAEQLPDDDALRGRLAELGLEMTAPLGFNNSYALGMREAMARRLGITRISDLKNYPSLRLGVSNEFEDREDGWRGLRVRYALPQQDVRGMEHALAYRALAAGDVDITDVYTTDSTIRRFNLRVLEDDLGHFPKYDAVYVYRQDLAARAAGFVEALRQLEGRIDAERMRALNERVELDREPAARVAAGFLFEELGQHVEVDEAGLAERVARRSLEHLFLVVVSLSAAIFVAVPLGVVAAKYRLAGQVILGVAEVIQTIPGLALLVFIGAAFMVVHLPMSGAAPAIMALFLYALLPIIRNTVAGLTSVPGPLKESAVALGLPPLARLRLIELPLASGMILAGIKTTAVITVGYAALGGLIAAGGYGQPIITGLRLYSVPTMMEGAIPAALMALAVKSGFEYSERWLVPRGLRLKLTH